MQTNISGRTVFRQLCGFPGGRIESGDALH